MKNIQNIIETTDQLSSKAVDMITISFIKPFEILSKIIKGPTIEEPKDINDAIRQLSGMSSF